MAERMASPVFVGRRAELAVLESALAQPERTAAVLVAGEAGAGKSRLVAEFTTAATAAGARVLAGACVALGAESLPYAPFMGVLGQLAAEVGPDGIEALVGPGRADLARLVPGLRRPGDDARPSGTADRAVLFQVVLSTLEAVGAQGPLVVVIEDLHWADGSSRELLAFLLGRLRGGVLVVATYRNDEVHRRHPLRPFLAETARSERVVRLDLGPLTPAEVTRQLEAIAGSALPSAIVDAVVDRAEGNPFFAEELLAAGGGEHLPPDLAEVLTARLCSLPGAAQELVAVAAVAGPRVGHELLAAAAGGVDIARGLREAVSHQVLVAGPDGAYAFRHALLGEAAYAELLPNERATLHAAYATALAAHPEWATTPGGVAGELAHHWLAARDRARALGASMEAAAAAAQTYAFAEAHGLYEQALDLWGRVPQASELVDCDRAQLLQRAADAAHLAGAIARAVELVRAALNHVDPVVEPSRAALLHWRLARMLWACGEGEASLAAHRVAVDLAPEEPSAERALILAAEGHVLMLAARYQESATRCEEAIAVARAAGARREEGHALNTLGVDLSRMADHERAVALLDESLAIAREIGSIEDLWRAYINLAATLDVAEELERAGAVARQGIVRLEALGFHEGAATLRGVAAMVLWPAGAWDEAVHIAARTLEGAPTDINALQAHEVLGAIAQRRGDFTSARAHLDQARRICSRSYLGFLADVVAAQAELALAEGFIEEARGLVEEGLDALAGSDALVEVLMLVGLGLRTEGDALALKGGRQAPMRLSQARSRAEGLTERWRALSADLATRDILPTRRSQVLALSCQAELARAQGRHDPGAWEAAAEAWTQISHPYEMAYARWRQAEALFATDARDEAVTKLRMASSEASRLGASPLVADIEALARRARVRLSSATGKPQSPGSVGSLGLTAREAEVLALVAAGHTNHQIAEALFMSDKTASVHVSRILTKLGVANRGQAASLAHRLKLYQERPAQ